MLWCVQHAEEEEEEEEEENQTLRIKVSNKVSASQKNNDIL